MTARPDDTTAALGLVNQCACGRVAYPTDAAWLAPRLLLVTFAACEGPEDWHDHAGAVSLVVDCDQLAPVSRCAGTTTTGARCRHAHAPGSRYCWQHDPDRPRRGQQARHPMDAGGGR